MGGIALVYNRDGAPAQNDILIAMLDRLRHRGADGRSLWGHGEVALGHQHLWTTPEEMGERQPLEADGGRVLLGFDGRLDNREDLIGALGLRGGEGERLSDASLVLIAYERWGEDLCEHLLGPFALALYDARSHSVLLGRDALGDRTLFYSLTPKRLVVGSEEGAVLIHPGISADLDDAGLVCYFALREPPAGSTWYAQVCELPPAHCLRVNAQSARSWRYWEPETKERLSYPSDEGYAARFRELLTASVACRLRSSVPVTVMMSGGLDSTSVAALASRQIAARGGERLRTVSFVFDELAECDEREYIQAVLAQCDAQAIYVPGDDAWPLGDRCASEGPADRPDGNPYRKLKQRVYARASQAGSRVILSGSFSDHMYSGAERWLADLLGEGRLAEAVSELLRYLRHRGLRRTLASATLRHLVRSWLAGLGASGGGHGRVLSRPRWLTPGAASRLDQMPGEAIPGLGARRPEQFRSMLGSRASMSVTREIAYAGHAGVELRYPFRDRRLVEFMLAIPTHQLFNRGLYKFVLRNAMRGLLPELLLRREQATSLLPLFVRGIYERERDTVQRLLKRDGARWSEFVRSDWLWALLSKGYAAPRQVADGLHQVVLWQCVGFECWQQGLVSNGGMA